MTNDRTPIKFTSNTLGESYCKYSHPSGLDIYIFKKKMLSSYAIFGTKYGSVHNIFKPDSSEDFISVPDGIAHFLEHKLFAAEDGSDAFERFSEYGADANAYTSFNKTCYLFSCTKNFDSSLRELLTFVTHPHFTDENVASEQGIIGEEISMYDDSPYDRCFYGMLEGLYHHHSIRKNICGSRESIAKITPSLLYSCYDAFYRPSNMVLVICGDVDEENCLNIADECLGTLPDTRIPVSAKSCVENEPHSVCKSYVEQHMQVSKPIFKIGYKDTDIPQESDMRQRRDLCMAILNDMIFSDSGTLYNTLMDKEMISPNLSTDYTVSEDFAFCSVSGEADDPKAVLKEITEFIEKTKLQGLSEDDFLRCKRVLYADAVRSFDSTDLIANNLFEFVCDGNELLSYTNVIESITFEEISALFQKSYSNESITLSAVLPIKNKQ